MWNKISDYVPSINPKFFAFFNLDLFRYTFHKGDRNSSYESFIPFTGKSNAICVKFLPKYVKELLKTKL